MLDDLQKIKEIDAQGAFEVAKAQWQQLSFDEYDLSAIEGQQFERIVLSGMGGSALAGLVAQRWWRSQSNIPLQVVREYDFPSYARSSKTLVITASYSGNTEEEVAALEEALSKKATIVTLSSGGRLEELAKEHGLPHLSIPSGLQPRMAVWYAIRLLAAIADSLSATKNAVHELLDAQEAMQEFADWLGPEVPTRDNYAKQIAKQLHEKAVVIYSGPSLDPAAYKWKISFNESSKNLAWSNQFSEFNHNEIMGWTSHPKEKPFAVVQLISSFDHPQIKRRFDITNELLAEQMPDPIIVEAKGSTLIEQILWTIQLGDFVSLYLAVLNGVDPTPVDTIEELKKRLND